MNTSMHTNSLLFHQTFLRGKPKAFGILLIVVGVLEIILGIVSASTPNGLVALFLFVSSISGIDFWGAIIYIVAGALTIVAGTRPNICMIKGSLALNIITAIFSFIAFIFVCVDLAALDALNDLTGGILETFFATQLAGVKAVLAILLILNLLLFGVSIFLSVFGCQALGHEPNTPPQVFVVQNTVVTGMHQPPPYPIS
ncbi:membrane-spanning 4-domains subfamily A member 15-like [Rana temporaria]|uniref:membrane-spanning 4-domains subfamily A member 15-like n=1 Tax=Rana temporaria TaxID=8407 RepID=UPI001AAD9FD1|nr:membrane-spanning 4-domains subfamily A member 15-like [Rana temporaria]